MGAQGWSDEIGTHLAIMAANGREAASLRLSPEHLGPLDIQISMKDGQANVVFGASSPKRVTPSNSPCPGCAKCSPPRA